MVMMPYKEVMLYKALMMQSNSLKVYIHRRTQMSPVMLDVCSGDKT